MNVLGEVFADGVLRHWEALCPLRYERINVTEAVIAGADEIVGDVFVDLDGR